MFGGEKARIVRFGSFEVDLQSGELRHKELKVKLQQQHNVFIPPVDSHEVEYRADALCAVGVELSPNFSLHGGPAHG